MLIRPIRAPWPSNFPRVVIHADEVLVKKHLDYKAAKTGNPDAALSLVQTFCSTQALSGLIAVKECHPVLVSVHAEEEWGKNAIPEVLADYIAIKLGWDVEANVVQANVVNHTGADGFSRLARQAVFSGEIDAGRNYVIVDDFIGQGGTIANLRGHIQEQGGIVVGTTVLTGKPFSATLALSLDRFTELKERHGDLEDWWLEFFGFDFGCLTESEARYLVRTKDADTIRDRILAAKQANGS